MAQLPKEEEFMLRRTIAVLTAGLVVGALAGPALAKGPSTKGGKKPVGTVASFDGTTLSVTMNDGSTATVTVAEDVQVKIDRRGRPAAKGNPTRGSLDDLAAGNLVLRMKVVDEVLEKIRLRRVAAAPAPALNEGEQELSDGTEDESDELEDVTEDEDVTENELEEGTEGTTP